MYNSFVLRGVYLFVMRSLYLSLSWLPGLFHVAVMTLLTTRRGHPRPMTTVFAQVRPRVVDVHLMHRFCTAECLSEGVHSLWF